MERNRWLRIGGLGAGILALAAQTWVAIHFVRSLAWTWSVTRPQLVSFTQSVDRFSQLKTPAFKYPAAAVYCVLAIAGLVIIIGAMTVCGVREALASTPPAPDDDPDATARPSSCGSA